MHYDHQIHNYHKVAGEFFSEKFHKNCRLNFCGLEQGDAEALIKGCTSWSFIQALGVKPNRALGMIDHEPSLLAEKAKASLVEYLEREELLPSELAEEERQECLRQAIFFAYGLTSILLDKGFGLEGVPTPLQDQLACEVMECTRLPGTAIAPRRPDFGADIWPGLTCCQAGKPEKGCNLG